MIPKFSTVLKVGIVLVVVMSVMKQAEALKVGVKVGAQIFFPGVGPAVVDGGFMVFNLCTGNWVGAAFDAGSLTMNLVTMGASTAAVAANKVVEQTTQELAQTSTKQAIVETAKQSAAQAEEAILKSAAEEIIYTGVTGNAQNALQAGAYQAIQDSRKLIGDQAAKEIFGTSVKRTSLDVALAASKQVSQEANQALAVASSKALAGNVGLVFTEGYTGAVTETLKVNSAATVNELVKAGLDGGTKAVVVDMVESATVDGVTQAVKESVTQLSKDTAKQTGQAATKAVSKTLFGRIGAWWGRDAATKAALKTSKALAKAAAKNGKTVLSDVTKSGATEGAVETAKGGLFSWAGAGVFGADVSLSGPPAASVLFVLPALPSNGLAHPPHMDSVHYSQAVRELMLDVLDPEVAHSNVIDIDWSSLQPGQVYQLTFEPTHSAPSALAAAPFLSVFSSDDVKTEGYKCMQNLGGMLLVMLVLFRIIRRVSAPR